jgi:ABC-type glycerol-3-phosphate transport system substrate-binding protein
MSPLNSRLFGLTAVALLLVLLLLPGCGAGESGRTVELWTDQPLLALYTELYNASGGERKVKLVYRADVAEAVLTEGGTPDVVIGSGLANRNLAPYVQEIGARFGGALQSVYPDLLELGRYDGAIRFVPLSFDLPAVEFLATTLPESAVPLISLEELRAESADFNTLESQRYVRMGFSPLWDERFLLVWAQMAGTSFTEIEELRVAWDQAALEEMVEEGVAWRREINGGGAAATAFAERYLYDPPQKLLRRGRIGFFYTTGASYLSRPEQANRGMSIRWLRNGDSIPVLPEIVYAAVPDRSRHRRGAKEFLRWLLNPQVQRTVMETALDRRIDSFGFLEGFSSLPEVNREVLTDIYPELLGRIPPEERLAFPAQIPFNWSAVETEVVGPWLREAIRLGSLEEPREPETDLDDAIDQWYRAHGL